MNQPQVLRIEGSTPRGSSSLRNWKDAVWLAVRIGALEREARSGRTTSRLTDVMRYYFPDVYKSLENGRYFIKFNVAGVSYRQEAVSRCCEDEPLALVRDIGNAHDRNAIKIFAGSDHIGFVPKGTNRGFAEYMDSGGVLEAEIEAIVGGESEEPNKGVVARLYIPPDVDIEFDDAEC